MGDKIRIGVFGYGNLGAAVESEAEKNPDMELTAVFTRRNPSTIRVRRSPAVIHADYASDWIDKIDVMILCGGSATDFPAQGLELIKLFNTVDSYDTHAKIPGYFEAMDAAAKSGNHISVISAGWDPGLFSLMRLYMGAIIPGGHTYTFWGKGVSQGHSEAIRRIDGVDNAIQYTVPVGAAVDSVRRGDNPELETRQKHTRLCYVSTAPGADTKRIENEIVNMSYYFADYDTTVVFVSNEELAANHGKLTHGGNVIHTGTTGGGESGGGNGQVMELSLKLDSNPEFTGSVMLAYARAAYRLSARGESGARTVLDIPPALTSPMSYEDMLKTLL